MASNLRKMEDALTCPICTDIYKQPVTLPCQHSYCRECLQLFSETPNKEKDTSANVDDPPSKVADICTKTADTLTQTESTPSKEDSGIKSSTSQSNRSVIVRCPVCRRPANLGSRGVANLPTNFILAEIVEGFQPEKRTNINVPLCGICEENNKIARIACPTCCIIYCKDCFTSVHPLKGALKQHVVISVEEFLSQQKAADPVMSEEANKGSGAPPTCYKHNETLSVYCLTCQELICNKCFTEHDKHSFSDIGEACEKEKVPFRQKVKVCEEMKEKVTECVQRIRALIDDITHHDGDHRIEIQREFDALLKSLETWRKSALETVQQKHDEWLKQCDAMLKNLETGLKEIDRVLITSKDITSGNDVAFLQEAKEFSLRQDGQLQAIREAIEKNENFMLKCNKFLSDDAVPLRYLSLREKIIQKPMLNFRLIDNCQSQIKEGGLFIDVISPSAVYTDGEFQSGQYYWEFEVIRNQEDEPTQCILCIEQVGYEREPTHNGKSYWGISVTDLNGSFTCHDDSDNTAVLPPYNRWNSSQGHHRLAFYLDCKKRTVTIIDCSKKQTIWTRNNIDVSKSLVPVFCFYGGNQQDIHSSVRLKTSDNATIKQILSELLRGS